MSKNNKKTSQSHDMWQNLLNNPMPPMPSLAYSSTAPQSSNPSPSNTGSSSGFAQFSPFSINPYSQPYYNQTGYNPIYGQFSPPFSPSFPPYQPSLHQSQYRDVETPPESEAEVEPEPEPEPEVEVDPHPKQKRRVVRWSEYEAVTLAQRWIDASENPTVGNSQSEEFLWNTILKAYNSLVDEKRSKNQLTGKWSKIRRDVKLFGAIFKKHNQMGRQSGADDKAVYDTAKAHFKDQNGRPFLYEACWHELKGYPKFWVDQGVQSQKRSFEDIGGPINLDEDEPELNPIPIPIHQPSHQPNPNTAMEALFRDDPIRRPPGRAASRKSQRSGSSSDATSSRISSDEAREQVARTAKQQADTLKKIEENNNKKLMLKTFKSLNMPINENLSKKERKLLEKARQSMFKEFAEAFGATSGAQDDDDDDDDDE